MKKTERRTLAKETVKITETGSYISSCGKVVDISRLVRIAMDGTVLYSLATMPGQASGTESLSTRIEVTGESTFDALSRLSGEGATRIGCLNFASAKNAGGGFLNGAEAQEEALARASALYACENQAPEYYTSNRANRSCLYLDLAIYSPEVPFFRDDTGRLLEVPVTASVITAPAPNAGAVQRNEPDRIPDIEPVLRRRAEMVLRIAVLGGIRNLVLGAWGCGVFRNDPSSVAQAFRYLLHSGGAYHGRFESVVFAVRDPEEKSVNRKAFQQVFAEAG